jgi:hypothetical protein
MDNSLYTEYGSLIAVDYLRKVSLFKMCGHREVEARSNNESDST